VLVKPESRDRSIWRIATVLAVLALPWIHSSALAAQGSLRQDVLTTWTTDQGLPQNFVRAISQTSDGFLWVGTMNGLVRFDGLRFRGFGKDAPSALQENIGDLEQDAGDGLWIATASGLIHYSHQRFQPIPLLGQSHYNIDARCGYIAMANWHGLKAIYCKSGPCRRAHSNCETSRKAATTHCGLPMEKPCLHCAETRRQCDTGCQEYGWFTQMPSVMCSLATGTGCFALTGKPSFRFPIRAWETLSA